jgi:ESF2/ABP1 family protein
MPADRTKKTRAGPSNPKARKYALPPIAGAGDDADVHAAREVAVGAVEEEGEGEGEQPVKKAKKKGKTPGIVYVSRIPPGMTPAKVRHLMAKWGEVGRVYAQPRDGEFEFGGS